MVAILEVGVELDGELLRLDADVDDVVAWSDHVSHALLADESSMMKSPELTRSADRNLI